MVSDEKSTGNLIDAHSKDLNGHSGKLVDDPSDVSSSPSDPDPPDLAPCSLCGRKFLSNRLEKHLIICAKIKEKKRKLFDAAKQRAENLDKINNHPMEIQVPEPEKPPTAMPRPSINKNKRNNRKSDGRNQIPQPKNNSNQSQTQQQQSNWRQQHQEFIRTIRAARGAPLIQDGDEEPVPTSGTGQLPPGVTECPTCSRRFSIKAADRHIQWCGENARKQKETKNSNEQKKNQEALERMKARTKYKPLLPGAGNNHKVGNQDPVQKRTRSLPRATNNNNNNPSTTTLSASSNESSNKSKASTIKNKSKNQNTGLTGRGISKVISKSSENVSSRTNSNNYNNGHQKSLMIKSLSPSVSRRTISKKSTNSNNNHMVASKVDSGIVERHGRNRNGHQVDGGGQTNKSTRNGEKSAPIMKFKEKFPNHHYQNNVKSIIDQFQDIEHILRRNSTAIYDDSPKTVPGVRTGGISPTKNQRTPTRNGDLLKSPHMSKSDTNLHKINDDDDGDDGGSDTDIKKRIDQYINHLYDNSHNNNGEFTMANGLNGLGSRLVGYGANGNGNTAVSGGANHQNFQRIIGPHEDRLILQQTVQPQQQQQQQPLQSTRQNSANSEEARMSTSDSTDSGLGVIFASANGNSSQLLETVNEDGKHSSSVGVGSVGANGNGERSSSKDSARTFRAGVLSPTMSDIETNNRLTLRNSSLNDIELLNGDLVLGPNGTTIMDTRFQGLLENRPRFCHQCGTKYPNVMAKFCYECGSRRYETV